MQAEPASRIGLIQALDLMADTLGLLQEQYEILLGKLLPHTPTSVFHAKIQTRPTNNGDAHVEVVDGNLNYVVTERGRELHRRIAGSSDEVLYWIIDDVIESITCRLRPSFFFRLFRKDPRRFRFATHIKLLKKVRPEWARRKRGYYSEILLRHPYRDEA